MSGESAAVEPAVKRRFSTFSRIVGVLFSPTETMKDISDVPDYLGVIVIIVMLVVVGGIGYWTVSQKLIFVGEYAVFANNLMGLVLSISLVILGFVLFGGWLIESLIVKYACDTGSGWSFRTAASVSGYTWMISVVRSVVTLPISYFLISPITIDTSGLPYNMSNYQNQLGQLRWLTWVYSLPVALLFLGWMSYAGAKGVNYGTGGNCSLRKSFAVFFVLGFLVLLPSLLV